MSEATQLPAPSVYALLAGEPNLAVDAALVEALPDLEPELQPVALDTLITRGRDRGLTNLVGNFVSYDQHLQELIVARVSGLYAGSRLANSERHHCPPGWRGNHGGTS